MTGFSPSLSSGAAALLLGRRRAVRGVRRARQGLVDLRSRVAAALRERLLDVFERSGYLEGACNCAGCHEPVDDDYEHDFCVTPVDRYESVAYSLLPGFAWYERRRGFRCWRSGGNT